MDVKIVVVVEKSCMLSNLKRLIRKTTRGQTKNKQGSLLLALVEIGSEYLVLFGVEEKEVAWF